MTLSSFILSYTEKNVRILGTVKNDCLFLIIQCDLYFKYKHKLKLVILYSIRFTVIV